MNLSIFCWDSHFWKNCTNSTSPPIWFTWLYLHELISHYAPPSEHRGPAEKRTLSSYVTEGCTCTSGSARELWPGVRFIHFRPFFRTISQKVPKRAFFLKSDLAESGKKDKNRHFWNTINFVPGSAGWNVHKTYTNVTVHADPDFDSFFFSTSCFPC